MNGNAQFRQKSALTLAALNVLKHILVAARTASGRSSPPLPAAIIPCFLSGIMNSVPGRGITLTTPHWEATSKYGGDMIGAPKATSTVGQQYVITELRLM